MNNFSCDYAPNGYICERVQGLDNCNAYIRTIRRDVPTLSSTFELVSYATPVCVYVAAKNTPMFLYVCGAASCSVTTQKHVIRFLEIYGFDYTTTRRVLEVAKAIEYDMFVKFTLTYDKELSSCEWYKNGKSRPNCEAFPRRYTPRKGFYNGFGYYVEGGSKEGFKCFKRN